jgi:hypothetical protein
MQTTSRANSDMSTDQTALKERREREQAEKAARIGRIRARMRYRAVLNIDFTNPHTKEYQRLIAALMRANWKYLETSALACEGNLANVLVALELISKQCEASGTLSALTLHIQGSTNLEGKPYPQSKSYPNALSQIRNKSHPEPTLLEKNE